MNVEVLDETFAASVLDCFSTLMRQSTLIPSYTFGQIRSRRDKILDWASYTLAHWGMLFLFFLIRREYKYRKTE